MNGEDALGPTGRHKEKPLAVWRHVAADRAGLGLEQRNRHRDAERVASIRLITA